MNLSLEDSVFFAAVEIVVFLFIYGLAAFWARRKTTPRKGRADWQ